MTRIIRGPEEEREPDPFSYNFIDGSQQEHPDISHDDGAGLHIRSTTTSGTDYDADAATTGTPWPSLDPSTTTGIPWDPQSTSRTRLTHDDELIDEPEDRPMQPEDFQISRARVFRCPTHGELNDTHFSISIHGEENTYCLRCVKDALHGLGCLPLQTVEESERQGDFEL